MIISKPYAERRVLIIAPKDDVEAKSTTVNWKDVLLVASSPLTYLGYRGVRAIFGAEETGPAKASLPSGVVAVPHHEAASALVFPPGHPLLDHSYAGHPLVAKQYLPFAAFHRILFEEKVNELLTLLASLGATRVKVTCSRGYRTAAGISIGVAKGAEAAAGVKGKSEQSEMASFEEHFRPTGEPKLPTNLVWYNSEASWQAVAQRRLNFGTSRFKALLSYEDSFGIDANLKVGLDKLGVKLSGNYSNFESTEWEFEGEFA